MDLYRPLLAKALFPAYEAARGRPTLPLLRYLESTERRSPEQLRDLQLGLLRRLLRHAYNHTAHYRAVMDERGIRPEDVQHLGELDRMPLLDRATVVASLEARTATAPPKVVITKASCGTTGQPVVVRYNEESRHWRDATRWRGYGWGGYDIGMRALHYWGFAPPSTSWLKRGKVQLDRFLKRDLYVDSTPRGEEALAAAIANMRRFEPHVVVAYAAGAAALARYVNENRLRAWRPTPVLVGAERLWPHDRDAIEEAFGPAFETYGCRETMLIASECEAHDGMHTSMETMIVELLVRQPDGSTRPAHPGEAGEVAVTDLHNLACPMIRYMNGDLAVSHGDTRCACGRGLVRIGPIEGRVTDTLRDGRGNPVSGLVFNILFATLDNVCEQFQVVQRADGNIVMRVVPRAAPAIPDKVRTAIHDFATKYLPGAPFAIEHVDAIPLSTSGKRKVVVVEKPS